MKWKIDHKKCGTLIVEWRIALVRVVPVLKRLLNVLLPRVNTSMGDRSERLLQPAESVEDAVLACDLYAGGPGMQT